MSILTQQVHFPDADNDWVFNDQASMRSNWSISPFYYIKLESADGIYGSDISTESHPVPNLIGEKSGDAFRRGKGVTLSGFIEGRNPYDLDVAADYLGQAFWKTYGRRLIWYYVDGTQIYLVCRVFNDLSITPNYSTLQPRWSWTVGLRADDPRTRRIDDDAVYPTWQA